MGSTPSTTQFIIMMYGFVVILSIVSTLCVLILIVLLLLYKLQNVFLEMERRIYQQRERRQKQCERATVNWIIESGPNDPASECGSIQDFSDQLVNEDAMTEGDKKRMKWQRKMTMDRIAHEKLIKRQDTSKIWKSYMKSKTFKGDSTYTMRSLSSMRGGRNQSSVDYLKSKTARSIEMKNNNTDCQLCQLPLKQNESTSPENCEHKFHQQCYDDWQRKYLVETGNIPPSCPFCKQN